MHLQLVTWYSGGTTYWNIAGCAKQACKWFIRVMYVQLIKWYKWRHNSGEGCRIYRVAPQRSTVPTYLVPKLVQKPQLSCLDPRGAFLIHSPSSLFLWQVSPE